MSGERRPTAQQGLSADTSFARQLRARRKELDLTQEALAELAGCSIESVKKIEAGRLRPSRFMAAALARGLHLDPEATAAFIDSARQSISQPPTTAPLPGPGGASTPNNLPLPPTALIGREAEVATVSARLREDGVRLLTLTGVGGTGKTRLALEVAARLLEDFPDGVYFVSLAPLADPLLVAPAIAAVLGVRELPSAELIDLLSAALGEKRVLLVLDNFEHLEAAAPRVNELLARTRQLKVLATSRERLHLRGEHEYQVPPLPTPDPQQLPPLAELARSAAVRLFLARVQDLVPAFALSQANAGTIAAICYRLDGLPLAIELAAPRIRLLTPAALLAQLNSRLRVLTGGAADLPQRQQTLRNTIAWSYNLLTVPEQMLLQRLSVFVGGATLESVLAICAEDEAVELDTADLLDELASLLDKHLVRREEQENGAVRFTMLETIREFAAEALAASGEESDLQRRHADHYCALAEHEDRRLWSAERLGAMAALIAEEDNFRAAFGWLLRQNRDETLTQALRLGATMEWYWNYRCHHAEGCVWLKAALDRGRHLRAAEARIAWARATTAILNLSAWQCAGQDSLILAQLQENIALLRELKDKRGLATALLALNDPSAWDERVRLAREIGDEILLAQVLWATADPTMVERLELAQAYAAESFELFSAAGDRWGAAMPYTTLGHIAWLRGDLPTAWAHLEQARALMEEAGDTPGVIWTSEHLGLLAFVQADHARARHFAEWSLNWWGKMGATVRRVLPLITLGLVAREQQDYALARANLHEAISIWLEPHLVEALAGVEIAQARREEAAPARHLALRAARLLGVARSLRETGPYYWFPVPPPDEDQPLIAACQELLDEQSWAAALAEGRALSPEAAVALALQQPGA